MATRSKTERLRAQERAEAARQRLAAEHRRKRLMQVLGAVGAVLLVVAILVIVKVTTGGGGPSSGSHAALAPRKVVREVATVPANVLNQVGLGSAQVAPKYASSAPALTADGKPRVVYVGAEYCPYCAAERWAFAVALSRFGTFHDLGVTRSSPSDVYPSTATLTFHGASYSSPYVSVTAKEIESNQAANGGYAPLDRLSAADTKLMGTYDAPPYFSGQGAIPFIDIGGKYLLSGASYSPQVLQGKDQQQIATALSDVSSPIAKGVDGTANLLTAAICRVTQGKPGSVCQSAGVQAAAAKLGNAG